MTSKANLTSPAQARARDRWDAKNPENKRRRTYKSTCKNYILNYLETKGDLQEVEDWISEAKKKLKNL